MRYLPVSVIEGFTAGIAVVISLQQVPAALGVADATGERSWAVAVDAVRRFAAHPRPRPPAAALARGGADAPGRAVATPGAVLPDRLVVATAAAHPRRAWA